MHRPAQRSRPSREDLMIRSLFSRKSAAPADRDAAPLPAVETLEGRALFAAGAFALASPHPLPFYNLDQYALGPDPGEAFFEAQNVGSIDPGHTLKHAVGTGDIGDIYKFTASADGKNIFNLSGLSKNADLKIYDVSQNLVAASENAGTANEKLKLNLTPHATYYARIKWNDVSGGTNFVLTMTGRDNAGNSVGNAHNLGNITNTTTSSESQANQYKRTGYVGSDDLHDYYKFNFTQYQHCRITMTNLTANANMELLNSEGQSFSEPFKSTNAGNANEELYFGAHSGTFYLKVSKSVGDTNYSLLIKTWRPY